MGNSEKVLARLFMGFFGAIIMAVGGIILIPAAYYIIWESTGGTPITSFLGSRYHIETMIATALGMFLIGLGLMLIL